VQQSPPIPNPYVAFNFVCEGFRQCLARGLLEGGINGCAIPCEFLIGSAVAVQPGDCCQRPLFLLEACGGPGLARLFTACFGATYYYVANCFSNTHICVLIRVSSAWHKDNANNTYNCTVLPGQASQRASHL
jgi:hypothetical protein